MNTRNKKNTKKKESALTLSLTLTLGTMSSTWLGHYPWFLTYNTLEKYVPEEKFKGIMKLVRNAGLGFCASFVSDW